MLSAISVPQMQLQVILSYFAHLVAESSIK